MGRKWSIIGRGWSLRPPRHFWVTFGTTLFSEKRPIIMKRPDFRKPIFVGKLFRQKSTSYGTSGRSAKWKMLVHRSSFFHRFFKFPHKLNFHDQHNHLPLLSISTPVVPERNTLSFEAIWDLCISNCISNCIEDASASHRRTPRFCTFVQKIE